MRTIVVLPAPLGPSSAKIVPASTVRFDLVEHGVIAERLVHARGDDPWRGVLVWRSAPVIVFCPLDEEPAPRGARRRLAAPSAVPFHSFSSTGSRSTRKSANAAHSNRIARRSGWASASSRRPSRASSPCSWYSETSKPVARGDDMSMQHPVHPLACRPGPPDEPEVLQRGDRTGDGAAARQQRLRELGDGLLARIAHRQVAEEASDHRRQPVAAGVEAADMIGECDLGIPGHRTIYTYS